MAGNIYHSWNGTVLTIQTDSGATSMDLKGEMGVRGPQGPAGGAINDVSLIDKTLTIENYAADAKTVGDALSAAVGAPLIVSAQGSIITTDEAADARLQGLRVFGKTKQNGTPTPDAPAALTPLKNIEIDICGINMLKDRSAGITTSANGLTFEHQLDGTIVVNGTSTKRTLETVNYKRLPAGTYRLGNFKSSGTGSYPILLAGVYKLDDVDKIEYYVDVSTGTYEFTLTEPRLVRFMYDVRTAGETYTDYKVKSYLRYIPANTYTPNWIAYQGSNLSINRKLHGITTISNLTYKDANGKSWYADEIDFARGVHIQRVKSIILDIKESDIQFLSNNIPYYHLEVDDAIRSGGTNELCSVCQKGSSSAGNCFSLYNYGQYRFYGVKGETAKSMVAKFNGAEFIYALAEPIETPLTEEEKKAFAAMYSLKQCNTIYTGVDGEFAVEYVADTKTYIDKRIQTLTDAIISLGGNI